MKKQRKTRKERRAARAERKQQVKKVEDIERESVTGMRSSSGYGGLKNAGLEAPGKRNFVSRSVRPKNW